MRTPTITPLVVVLAVAYTVAAPTAAAQDSVTLRVESLSVAEDGNVIITLPSGARLTVPSAFVLTPLPNVPQADPPAELGGSGTAVGAFEVSRSKDPLTDHESISIFTTATSTSGGRPGRSSGFGFLCAADGSPRIGWMFGSYVIQASVTHRFDSDPPSREGQWTLLSGNQGAAMPQREIEDFVRRAVAADRLIVRLRDRDGETFVDQFSLDGLREGLSPMPCFGKSLR